MTKDEELTNSIVNKEMQTHTKYIMIIIRFFALCNNKSAEFGIASGLVFFKPFIIVKLGQIVIFFKIGIFRSLVVEKNNLYFVFAKEKQFFFVLMLFY